MTITFNENIINEVIKTEESFRSGFISSEKAVELQKIIAKEIDSGKYSDAQISKMSDLNSLLNFCKKLDDSSKQLEAAIRDFKQDPNNTSNQKKLMESFKNHFAILKPYVLLYEKTLGLQNGMQKDVAFNSLFEKLDGQVKDQSKKDFITRIITPVQRGSRYDLLIQDLIKSAPEKEFLNALLSQIKASNQDINNASRAIFSFPAPIKRSLSDSFLKPIGSVLRSSKEINRNIEISPPRQRAQNQEETIVNVTTKSPVYTSQYQAKNAMLNFSESSTPMSKIGQKLEANKENLGITNVTQLAHPPSALRGVADKAMLVIDLKDKTTQKQSRMYLQEQAGKVNFYSTDRSNLKGFCEAAVKMADKNANFSNVSDPEVEKFLKEAIIQQFAEDPEKAANLNIKINGTPIVPPTPEQSQTARPS